jgi:hypothetical protein
MYDFPSLEIVDLEDDFSGKSVGCGRRRDRLVSCPMDLFRCLLAYTPLKMQ